ncbi:MAG: glycosyltransferase [Geodermatophilaceae bacterium]
MTVVRQSDDGFRAAAARNLGARAAQGEILCFLDGDTVPTSEYVRTLTRLPALLRDAVVTGHRRHADLTGATAAWVRNWLTGQAGPPPEIPEPQWLTDLHHRSNNLLHLDRHSYQAVISAVLGCPASLYAEVGGFDEAFTAYGGEDWEFGYRALNTGAVLRTSPAQWPGTTARTGAAATRPTQRPPGRRRRARPLPWPSAFPASTLPVWVRRMSSCTSARHRNWAQPQLRRTAPIPSWTARS